MITANAVDAFTTANVQDLSAVGGATSSTLLRATASSSPPPVHTVEEEVGDDTQEDVDDDIDDSHDENPDLPNQRSANGNLLPIVGMSSKHRIRRKSKPMLALGGKKPGKGKGSLNFLNSVEEYMSMAI